MTTDDVKQMFLGIRESLEQKLYNECMKEYHDYRSKNNLDRLPKVGMDTILYDEQCAKAETVYNKCRAVYNQRLAELGKTLDSVSDELEHRLWFHMMDEINP